MSPSRMTARVTQIALWVVGILLTLRFVLRLLNADATNRLVRWVYENTSAAVSPFFQWFHQVRLGDGFVVEFATLFALVSYFAIGFAVLAIIGTYRTKANSVANDVKSPVNISLNR